VGKQTLPNALLLRDHDAHIDHWGVKVMPYRHAHYYLIFLMVLTAVAFWPAYFSVLPSAGIALHVHGFTASLWIGLLTFQSWSIHRRHNEWHRAVGIASLAIFPLFFAGSLLIVHTMASNFVSGDFFDSRFGSRFAAIDAVAIPGIAVLFWSGLRWRRKVHLHARYMLATVFFLFSPIFSRLFMRFVPGLQLAPPDLTRVPRNVEAASLCALLLALALAWKQPKHARPWLLTAGLLGVQMILFVSLGAFEPWDALVREFASIPAPLLFSAGLAGGAVVSWHGWNSIPPRTARSLEALSATDA
jgi:hypothetical protein